MKKKSLSRFLLERPHAVCAKPNGANRTNGSPDVAEIDAQISALAERAQKCINSPLVRKHAAYPRFAVGQSTFSKMVKARELPQPIYCGSRMTAYREIDLDMTLAAQTLASRHGFMLNMKAFVAVLSSPGDITTKVNA